MKKLNQVWELGIDYLKRKLRSPFSNLVTKTMLFVGVAIVTSPILEHLFFSAILKNWLGIDLKIQIPDLNAYLFGTLIIFLAAIHNLLFTYLNHEYEVKIKNSKSSIYRELWEHCFKMCDDVVRLQYVYCPEYLPRDYELALKADESITIFTNFLNINRPFFISEEFYKKGRSLIISCINQVRYCRTFIDEKSVENTDYEFYLAKKLTVKQMDELIADYEEIYECIRLYIDSL